MGIVLGANQYGKAENRVVRLYRDTARHEIRDLNVSTALRGDFAAAHVEGDQRQVLPTDTQKNTAFAYAKQHGVASPEDYALALGQRLLAATPAATGARVAVEEFAWRRVEVDGVASGRVSPVPRAAEAVTHGEADVPPGRARACSRNPRATPASGSTGGTDTAIRGTTTSADATARST